MDRQSWIAVLLCVAVMIGWQSYLHHRYPDADKPPVTQTKAAAPSLLAEKEPALVSSKARTPASAVPEQTALLENAQLKAWITSQGGGISRIELKEHALEPGQAPRVVLNPGKGAPIFNLTGWDGLQEDSLADYTVAQNGTAVTATRMLPGGLRLERTYELVADYQIKLHQRIVNPKSQAVTLPASKLTVGTVSPLHQHDSPQYLTAAWWPAQAQKFRKTQLHHFDAGSFLGMAWRQARETIPSEASDGPLAWTSVQNQFFALIAFPSPEAPFTGAIAHRLTLPDAAPKNTPVPEGLRVEARVAAIEVPALGHQEQNFKLYAGPKEHARLVGLGQNAQYAMDFGWFGMLVVPLLSTLRFLHGLIPNYGAAIVLLTVLIRLAFWPLQSAANRSMKKMQALSPKVETLRTKYKDDPARLNQELISLYKEYGVNPAGGCLPLLVQLPVFIAFYVMLQSATELRNESFLWVHDLTQPDTVALLPYLGWAINPLPLLMTATSVLTIRLTPSSGNAGQLKFMQWLPVIFLVLFYNFAAALSLYMTVSNILSMIQSWHSLKQPLPTLTRAPKKA